jgi:hypothetical protein
MCLTLRGVLSGLFGLENGRGPRALNLVFFEIRAITIREMAKYRKLLVLEHSDGERNKDNRRK